MRKPSFWWIALIFIAALLPRVTNLDVFLAHDETLFWDWSRQFFFSMLAGDFTGTIVGLESGPLGQGCCLDTVETGPTILQAHYDHLGPHRCNVRITRPHNRAREIAR